MKSYMQIRYFPAFIAVSLGLVSFPKTGYDRNFVSTMEKVVPVTGKIVSMMGEVCWGNFMVAEFYQNPGTWKLEEKKLGRSEVQTG